jgi:PAB-dependent poly(A)-specific ribonuclease subunit 2
MMRRSGQYICAATSTGSAHILDPTTLKIVKEWSAHKSWINDMDAKADFLVTCGYSPRANFGQMLDPMAQVFDLKTLHLLPPIPFPMGGSFVRMHPRMSTTSIVASQSGLLHIVDIMNPNGATLRQVSLYEGYLTSLELSPVGEAIAMTDSNGSIRLWGNPSKVQFSEYGHLPDFPDAAIPNPSLKWSANE